MTYPFTRLCKLFTYLQSVSMLFWAKLSPTLLYSFVIQGDLVSTAWWIWPLRRITLHMVVPETGSCRSARIWRSVAIELSANPPLILAHGPARTSTRLLFSIRLWIKRKLATIVRERFILLRNLLWLTSALFEAIITALSSKVCRAARGILAEWFHTITVHFVICVFRRKSPLGKVF